MSDQANEVPAWNLFEADLGRQILASERERASLQAAIGVGLLLIVGVVSIAEANPLPAFTSALLMVVIVIISGVAMRQFFLRHLRQERQLPPAIRYANVAIETSFPTILLAAFTQLMPADVALT